MCPYRHTGHDLPSNSSTLSFAFFEVGARGSGQRRIVHGEQLRCWAFRLVLWDTESWRTFS
jgi:hypothetical protein